jgi:hypothetical protein
MSPAAGRVIAGIRVAAVDAANAALSVTTSTSVGVGVGPGTWEQRGRND